MHACEVRGWCNPACASQGVVQSLTRGGTTARPLLGLRTGGCSSRVSARCVSTRVGSSPRPRVPRSRHLATAAKVSPRQSTHGRAGSHGRYPCRCLSSTTVVKRHDRSTASPAPPNGNGRGLLRRFWRTRIRAATQAPAGAPRPGTWRCVFAAPTHRVDVSRFGAIGATGAAGVGLTRLRGWCRLEPCPQGGLGARSSRRPAQGAQASRRERAGRTRRVTAAPRWQRSVQNCQHRKAQRPRLQYTTQR